MTEGDIINESAEVIQRLRNYNATLTLIGGFDVADPVIKEAIKMIAKLTIPLSDEWSNGVVHTPLGTGTMYHRYWQWPRLRVLNSNAHL